MAEEETEPEVTSLMAVIPECEDVPPPQAFPYVTHTVDSDRDDVQEIARTPFGNTLVQSVCRNMNDVEANEAVMNKHWFRQVADAEQPRLEGMMGVSTRLHMTRPQWVERRFHQSEAALWSGRSDKDLQPARSSHELQQDDVQLPLHEMLQPSIESIENFLADEAKEMEQLSAQHLLTLARNKPSSASETSSQEVERLRQEEEYEQALAEQEENEEDEDEDYWKSYYEQLL